MSLLNNLWNTVSGWATQNANHFTCLWLPDPNTKLPVVPPHAAPTIRPNVDYFRVWLCEMFLTKSRTWFQDWHPAVSAQVRLRFGGQDTVTFSHVARPPEGALAKGVYLNYALSELTPYGGGVVEIQSSLLALKGDNSVVAALKVLQGFSSLVTAPLGQALAIAQQVTTGIEAIADATNGSIHLGFHQRLAAAGGGGANLFQPGYVAVVLAPATVLGALSVIDDRLHAATSAAVPPAPLTGYDYMLFRIEGRSERDDWRLPNIEASINKAIEALAGGENDKYKAHRNAALFTAFTSPDLTVADRRRVVEAIKAELAAVEGGGLNLTAATRSLNDIVATRAMSPVKAAALGEMTVEELFGP